MKDINVYTLHDLNVVKPSNDYVGIHLSGLIGDTIHASCRFKYIKERFPNQPWIIIHSYPNGTHCKTRVTELATNLMAYHFHNDTIAYYFCDSGGSGASPYNRIPAVVNAFKQLGIQQEKIIECVYNHHHINMSYPDLGIDILQEKDPKKAVIFRRSTWHSHFPSRNRPENEWLAIEQDLHNKGYDIYLFGLDDEMKTNDFVKDYRGKLSIYDILNMTANASICISVATFLYQWAQHICPTFVLSSHGDCNALNTAWKLNSNLHVINVDDPNYFPLLQSNIKPL